MLLCLYGFQSRCAVSSGISGGLRLQHPDGLLHFADLIVSLAFDEELIRLGEGEKRARCFEAALESLYRALVIPKIHVRLTETVVRQRKQRIDFDRLGEFARRALELFSGHELTSVAVVRERVAVFVLSDELLTKDR